MISSKSIATASSTAVLAIFLSFGAHAAEQPVEAQAPVAVEAAPVEAAPAAEAPAAETAATPASPVAETEISAKDLAIGSAVFGNDGEKIGEVNRVTASASGTVTEIQVTTGGKAGLGADVVAISGDKITAVSDGVKLSLSSQEAKSLPVIDGNG
jgi:hypothetical protein